MKLISIPNKSMLFMFAFCFFMHEHMDGQIFHRLYQSQQKSFLYDDEDEEVDSIHGLSFGLNLGSYFGGAASAAIYNGSGPFGGYLNEAAGVRWYSVAERIGADGVFINDIRDINTFYNSTSYRVPYDSYPTNMKYNPSMYVGLQLKWNFNRYSAIVMNVNALKLKAVSQFTLQFIGTPLPLNAQSDTRLFTITGEEQRFNINLGYRQGWMMGDFSNFYIQFGGSMLGTKWTSNTIRVADRNYNLVTSAPVQGATPQSVTPQAGIGFGAYASTGVEFWVGKYSFDISFGFSRDKVIIHTFEKNVWNKWIQASFTL